MSSFDKMKKCQLTCQMFQLDNDDMVGTRVSRGTAAPASWHKHATPASNENTKLSNCRRNMTPAR